jgi:hypothetical protein
VGYLELRIPQDLVEFPDLLLIESAGVTSAASVRRRRTAATAGRTTVEAAPPAATTASATAEVAPTAAAADPKKLECDVLQCVEARFIVGSMLRGLTLSIPGRTKAE